MRSSGSSSEAGDLIAVYERERELIALNLHDNVLQPLASTLHHVQAALPEVKGSRGARQNLLKAAQLAREALDAARNLAGNLVPPTLERLGLVASLQYDLNRIHAEAGWESSFQADIIAVPREMELQLYRILSEAIVNARRHSASPYLRVHLWAQRDPPTLLAEVRDYGRGFDESSVPLGRLGLVSMRSRAAALGGECQVRSVPGQGTTVVVRVPLPPAPVTRSEALVERLRLLVVDDHPVVREGIRAMLAAQPEMEVVGEASNGTEAVTQVEQLRPDVVLMDMRMPEMDGLQATRAIKQAHPETTVVVLTMYDHDGWVVEALRAGATGYLVKDSSLDLLLYTVRAARSGATLVKSSLLQKALGGSGGAKEPEGRQQPLLPWDATEDRPPGAPAEAPALLPSPRVLTAREQEVLELVVHGRLNKEIAQSLHITEFTVKKHVASILGKMDAVNRGDAAVRAIVQGLVRAPHASTLAQ